MLVAFFVFGLNNFLKKTIVIRDGYRVRIMATISNLRQQRFIFRKRIFSRYPQNTNQIFLFLSRASSVPKKFPHIHVVYAYDRPILLARDSCFTVLQKKISAPPFVEHISV